MTHRHAWTSALTLILALLLLAASDLAAEPNLAFNLKAHGANLSCETADIEKALSGAHPKTSLRVSNTDGYTALWLEMKEFDRYHAYQVINDAFASETQTYWLGILDNNQLGIIGRAKGTDPGPRSHFTELPHQNEEYEDYFALKVIWVNKADSASEPSVADENDHWFLENSNRDDISSVNQGTKAEALNRESTAWITSR